MDGAPSPHKHKIKCMVLDMLMEEVFKHTGVLPEHNTETINNKILTKPLWEEADETPKQQHLCQMESRFAFHFH